MWVCVCGCVRVSQRLESETTLVCCDVTRQLRQSRYEQGWSELFSCTVCGRAF